jgi:hypothetical protein
MLHWLAILAKALGHPAMDSSTAAMQTALQADDGAFAGLNWATIGPLGLSIAPQAELAASA